jgi:translation initiation factor IF-2
MAVGKRLSKIAKECNVGINTIVEFLHKKGFEIESNPNTKVSEEMYDLLKQEYRSDLTVKMESEKLVDRKHKGKKSSVSIDDLKENQHDEDEDEEIEDFEEEVERPVKPVPKKEEKTTAEIFSPRPKADVKVVGKIDLDKKKTSEATKKEEKAEEVRQGTQPSVVKDTDKTEPEEEKKETGKQGEKTEEKTKEKTRETTATKKIEEERKQPEKDVNIPVEPRGEKDLKVVGKIEPEKKSADEKREIKKETAEPINRMAVSETKTPGKMEEAKVTAKQPQIEEKKEEKKRDEKTEKSIEKPTEKPAEKPQEAKPEIKLPGESEKQSVTEQGKADKDSFMPTRVKKLSGPTVVGKINLPENVRSENNNREEQRKKKKKRKRIRKEKERVNIDDKQQQTQTGAKLQEKKEKRKKSRVKKRPTRPEVSEEDVQKQIKETLARLTAKGKSRASRHRRDKRDAVARKEHEAQERMFEESKVLKVTEFLTANELANLMDVQVNQVIATCMSLGLFVSINQRLDAETIALVAEEYGYKVEFISVDAVETIDEENDRPEDLQPRPPIITVMGHVDHGKTSLLDHIRSTNVIAGEAGGITQHIGAYNVKLDDGREITFLDTPGHEAFTAMRARGAQVTDIAIIIVAADDNVMPQTVEAINHASAAGVPIVFAINKIDKPNANPDRVKEELAKMNYLVEEWGGKYQSQDISAKKGINVDKLLEKVLLEADLLEFKANPNKPAVGSVIESSLDRGRGYVATLLVQSGTLKTGDLILSGQYYGHVKAMFNERNQKIEKAGPSQPALVLGLNGAPQAGEKFHVMENERETREIATKRSQLQREQGLRTQKHITLDEIGRRIAIGNFQELNLVVKGDVDGSIEALSDSLIKLSTEEIQVNVIHKAVGQITESDIMLAAASNAIVIGFQVRPSMAARRLAEKEEIDIRLYSIIYDAIGEIKSAMEGMLSPEIKEQIVATLEIRDTFRITKVGTVAGCVVKEGKIKRNSKVRVIRDGIVIYTGELGSLKRFKDDVKEVASGYECGLNIKNFNDIKVGDMIEAFEEVEVSRTL